MTRDDLIAENEARKAALLDDIAAREMRSARGEDLPEWQSPRQAAPQPVASKADLDALREFAEGLADASGELIAERENVLKKSIIALAEKAGGTTGALEKRIQSLESEIAALKVDIGILTAHKAAKPDITLSGSVTPMRRADVA